MDGWFFAARSSSIAWEDVGWPLLARSGAWNGVQPSVGSMNRSSRVLSLPFSSSVGPAMLPALDVVSCAVCPVAGLSRYSVVTLSDGSWSTMSKFCVTGQSWPVPSVPPDAMILLEVPSDGTTSLPSASSRCAAVKKLMPLQNDTWPNTEPAVPLTQFAPRNVPGVAPTWVRSVPLNPKSMVTTAFLGSVGTTGATAGVVPWGMTSGSYTESLPFRGFKIVAWTNAPRLAALVIVQPETAGDWPSVPVS